MKRIILVLILFCSRVYAYDFTLVDKKTISIVNNGINYDDINSLTHELNKNTTSDVEKCRAYYIWLTHSIVYDISIRNDIEYINNSHTNKALYAFKKKRGTCSEIAIMFKIMCEYSNILCIVVCGDIIKEYTKDLKNKSHAWNSVMIDNKIYFIDATWGATTKYIDNQLFYESFFMNFEYYKKNYNKITFVGVRNAVNNRFNDNNPFTIEYYSLTERIERKSEFIFLEKESIIVDNVINIYYNVYDKNTNSVIVNTPITTPATNTSISTPKISENDRKINSLNQDMKKYQETLRTNDLSRKERKSIELSISIIETNLRWLKSKSKSKS